MTHPPNALHAHPDDRIDQALNALRTAAPPSGLEQRIAARIANAAEARSVTASPFAARTASRLNVRLSSPLAVILNAVKYLRISLAPATRSTLATTSLAALAALSFFTLHTHYPTPAQSPTSASILPLQPAARTPTTTSPDSAELQPLRNAPGRSTTLVGAEASAAANALVPRGFSLESHRSLQRIGALTLAPQHQPDPDAIALAETLAPSRPAPPEPLTQQELLIETATRPGQPIQLAELDIARTPMLRAATEAREQARIRHYVARMLAPFAAAEALSPTTFVQPQEIFAPAPAPLPTISLAN